MMLTHTHFRDQVDCVNNRIAYGHSFFFPHIGSDVPKDYNFDDFEYSCEEGKVWFTVGKPIFDNQKNGVPDNVIVEIVLKEGFFPRLFFFLLVLLIGDANR